MKRQEAILLFFAVLFGTIMAIIYCIFPLGCSRKPSTVIEIDLDEPAEYKMCWDMNGERYVCFTNEELQRLCRLFSAYGGLDYDKVRELLKLPQYAIVKTISGTRRAKVLDIKENSVQVKWDNSWGYVWFHKTQVWNWEEIRKRNNDR